MKKKEDYKSQVSKPHCKLKSNCSSFAFSLVMRKLTAKSSFFSSSWQAQLKGLSLPFLHEKVWSHIPHVLSKKKKKSTQKSTSHLVVSVSHRLENVLGSLTCRCLLLECGPWGQCVHRLVKNRPDLRLVTAFPRNSSSSPRNFFDVSVVRDGVFPVVYLLLSSHQNHFICLQFYCRRGLLGIGTKETTW